MGSTINDVAKLAGVSRQTVSRVLNEPDRVQGVTLERVQKAIELLDYHPNITARNLANRTVRSIGLFMPFTAEQIRRNLFFSLISNSVCMCCAEHDFVLQLFTSVPEEEYSDLFKRLYYEKRVGGLIITCPTIRTTQLVELIGHGIPFVLIGRPPVNVEGINYIDSNNRHAAYLATAYVLEQGHRDLMLMNAAPWMTLSEDLRDGFNLAHKEQGLTVAPDKIVHTALTYESAYQEALAILRQPSPPTAIVTADDLLALAVMRAAEALGINIPGQLSLVCVEHNGWGEVSRQRMAHIESGSEQLGVVAAQYLVARINGTTSEMLQQILPVRLVEGETVRKP